MSSSNNPFTFQTPSITFGQQRKSSSIIIAPKNVSVVIAQCLRAIPLPHPTPFTSSSSHPPDPAVITTDWWAPTGACPSGFRVQTHSALSSLPAPTPNQTLVSPTKLWPQGVEGAGARAGQCACVCAIVCVCVCLYAASCTQAEGVHINASVWKVCYRDSELQLKVWRGGHSGCRGLRLNRRTVKKMPWPSRLDIWRWGQTFQQEWMH